MKRSFKIVSFIALDIAVAVISTFVAALLRFEFNIPPGQYQTLGVFLPIAVCSTVLCSMFVGVYKHMLSYFGFAELISQVLVSGFVMSVLLATKLFFIPRISGSITIIYCMVFFAISVMLRAIPRVRRWLSTVVNIRYGKTKRVIIVGAGDAGVMVAKQLIESSSHDMYPVAFVDDDQNKIGQKVVGLPVRGNLNNIEKIAKQSGAHEIIVAIPSAGKKAMMYILDKALTANLPTKVFRDAMDAHKFIEGEKSALKEVSIEDLLFREPIVVENSLNRELIEGKVVMVTGGVGSIGSELCRQVLQNGCKKLIIFDIHENGLFELNEELKGRFAEKYITCLGSVRDVGRIESVFERYKPNLIFHAAAHKHVPMMEINPFEAIKNNVIGTQNVIKAAAAHKAEKLILISTDKAVHPANVMGATKRMCEMLIKAYGGGECEMVAVRFGNVLESNGSVIPLFKRQIANGGPVTVTHREMTRYFMTIKEAVSLVLSAGAFAKNSELFVLDMGEPVKIYDLATSLIRLSGKTPDVDVKIEVVGLRPGEKLYEEIVHGSESVDNTSHHKIFILRDKGFSKQELISGVAQLKELCDIGTDEPKLRSLLFDLIGESEVSQSVTI